MANIELKEFKLRHSKLILPVHLVFLAVAVYFGIHGAGMWSIFVFFVLLSYLVFLSYWHRVTYQDGIIVGVLFPKKPISINISDITSIKEQSDIFRYETRRCIAICSERDHKIIKVSLIFFIRSDIRKLMQIVHETRPDLVVPEKWTGTKW